MSYKKRSHVMELCLAEEANKMRKQQHLSYAKAAQRYLDMMQTLLFIRHDSSESWQFVGEYLDLCKMYENRITSCGGKVPTSLDVGLKDLKEIYEEFSETYDTYDGIKYGLEITMMTV